MASALTTAHGQGKVLGGILHSTTQNVPGMAHMRGLDRLVTSTTGLVLGTPVMDGVITQTVPASMQTATPEYLPIHEQDKTGSKMAVGIPYAGAVSGYGGAKAQAKKKGKK